MWEGDEPVLSDDPELTLPHPRAHERAFVLVPWRDADPEAELPGYGRIADLVDSFDADKLADPSVDYPYVDDPYVTPLPWEQADEVTAENLEKLDKAGIDRIELLDIDEAQAKAINDGAAGAEKGTGAQQHGQEQRARPRGDAPFGHADILPERGPGAGVTRIAATGSTGSI